MRPSCPWLSLAVLLTCAPLSGQTRRLRPDDLYALKSVGDPRLSPDGKHVAYTVGTADKDEDAADTDIWMAPVAGGAPLRLTTSAEAETDPRFSPDGRYLAFLSSREGETVQVWLLDRRGGEAVQMTDFGGDVRIWPGRRTAGVWRWWCETQTPTIPARTGRRTIPRPSRS